MANSSIDVAAPLPAQRLPGRWAPAWVIAFVALWPAPGIAEGVLVLGALFTVVRLLQLHFKGGIRPLLSIPAWALTGVLFMAYWLPQAVSALDAADPGRAWGKVVGGLRYLPFMWLVAIAVATPARRKTTFRGLAVITGLWTIDALLQALTGGSPLFWSMNQLKWLISGHALCTAEEIAAADRLSGIFGPCNLKFGQVLASISPFFLYFMGERFGRAGWLLAAGGLGIVLVLAGSRASWITYALVVLISGWSLLGRRWLGVVFLAGVLSLGIISTVSEDVHARVTRTMAVLNGDSEGLNKALTGRMSIWSTAVAMVREHPLNGVGVRGFREAYSAYDRSPAETAGWGTGAALHAHQILLEILSETGALGLLFWLAGVAMALRAWLFADIGARAQARPAALALMVTVFPLNTHLAFYSAFWGGLTMLLAALYGGALVADDAVKGGAELQKDTAEMQ